MENIFTVLVVLLGISLIGWVVLYLIHKIEKPAHFDMVYDHIEEELPKKVVKRKKSTTNVKRQYKKKDGKGPVA